MKIGAILLATIATSASAFSTPAANSHTTRNSMALNAESVPLANGSMSFNRVCREWRCKYDGDKSTSESLEAISKVLDECLPEISKASKDITINRLVCGGCLDFKLMMTVPLEDFGAWEEK
ncbi:MAG: hypothetical protein ACI8RD_003461 [Bacillariaceae sp.]|jgi:hypothetical protein